MSELNAKQIDVLTLRYPKPPLGFDSLERQHIRMLLAHITALTEKRAPSPLDLASVNYRYWRKILAITPEDDGWAEINDQCLAAQRAWEDETDRKAAELAKEQGKT